MASKRGYLTTIAELEEYADITVTDTDEAWDQISMAEEIIDSYVGYQEKHIAFPHYGEVTAVSGKTITDNLSSYIDDYLLGCQLEVMDGSGQVRKIASSSFTGQSLTYEGDDLSPAPTTGTPYKVTQLGKFPRHKDIATNRAGTRYYKSIPEAVKRATAAQVEYIINMGADFFGSNQNEMDSEQIGKYSYSSKNAVGQSAVIKMTAPKARALLRGIKNSTGRLVAE